VSFYSWLWSDVFGGASSSCPGRRGRVPADQRGVSMRSGWGDGGGGELLQLVHGGSVMSSLLGAGGEPRRLFKAVSSVMERAAASTV